MRRNLYCDFSDPSPRGIDILVVQQPQHGNVHCKFLVWERSKAIGQNDDAGGKGVLHMLLDIFEDNLEIGPATADGPNETKIIFIRKGLVQ